MKVTDEMLYEAAPEAEKMLMENLPSEEECKVEFSEDFEKKVYRTSGICRSVPGRRWYKHRKIAVAAAACILLCIVGVAPVSANLYERFIRFATVQIEGNTEVEKAALKQVSFGYLPEGMNSAGPSKMGEDMYVYYPYDETGHDLQLIQMISDVDAYEAKLIYEGEMKIRKTDGIEYILVSETDNVSVTWVRYGYTFYLSGNLKEDEVLKIAQNIYIDE